MELIADILLVAGALGAGLYCFVLSRRLKRFTDLEKGVGGAVAVLSRQAEELKKSLDNARSASDQSGDKLTTLTHRAESVAQQLELMMASMHDVIPEDASKTETQPEAVPAEAQPQEPTLARQEDVTEPSDDAESSETEAPKTKENKAPEGLMFFRHDHKQGGTLA
ncbi:MULTISPECIES: hypothetical protein [unclassified Ruegeria]|uniref:hypothetical protein n=1 Tax=unclassified Ruegeria TaxID=2625375 RepID=UPI0014891D83|nr:MULTISPECIES: hypothetical protein [unclassified Ruegeria]NOD33170.1 hypothetical protein [Ruegeria sp. HKCCD7296]NOE33946.1 hypothetical protein [Ruegeria sp. HKCCD7318]NOE41602.1 hypothetical protein [Ruegeria sp. HKCCD7319]